jgi:hypothetical protein
VDLEEAEIRDNFVGDDKAIIGHLWDPVVFHAVHGCPQVTLSPAK